MRLKCNVRFLRKEKQMCTCLQYCMSKDMENSMVMYSFNLGLHMYSTSMKFQLNCGDKRFCYEIQEHQNNAGHIQHLGL